MKDKYKRFWLNDKLQNISRDPDLMQGEWNIGQHVKDLKKELNCLTLLDFGCGWGRLFNVFKDQPTTYFGIDLNPAAIQKAQKTFPQFKNRFAEVDIDSRYPPADMYVALTVFLHLDDRTLAKTLDRVSQSCRKYLVIIEALGKEWREAREEGNKLPLYNRDLEDYQKMIESRGFELVKQDKFYNEHYGSQVRFEDFDCNTYVLVFRKL